MARANSIPKKFRPERPIYLNEQNTSCKSKIETIYCIEQLRALGWLCCYSEASAPLHMAFNSMDEYSEFKQSCAKLKITLREALIKPDDDIPLIVDTPIIPPEPIGSYEDVLGKLHIE